MSRDASPQTTSIAEFTIRAVGFGLLFGAVFGAANAYLGLKAGLTVSTSIPIAVLSAAVFRALGGGRVLLEANMAQTVGSASSSLASGTIFTIPALFMWSERPSLLQIACLAFLGGVLGILAMVPLRRLLIVKADAELPYPEGRACAEVLRATESDSSDGRWIFIGIAAGGLVKLVTSAFHWIPEEAGASLGFLPNATLAIKIAPALLAVGFIVGFRAASVMVAGSLVTALVLHPLLASIWAEGHEGAVLSASDAKNRYIIYVGAGAVAAAGIITVLRTTPTMIRSLMAVIGGLGNTSTGSDDRTDRDMSGRILVLGLAALALVVMFVPGIFSGNLGFGGRVIAGIGVMFFGFIFVPVSSRLVGVIGVSSNPTSAMALITIAGTAAVFAAAGFAADQARLAVITIGTVVCVAASKAGDISQDLKTGQLVGATPARQQFGQLIAASVACFAVAGVVWAIGNGPEGFVGERSIPAPQARLMKTVVEAVLGEQLPWTYVSAGAAITLVGFLSGLPALPYALGIYLPLSTMAAVFAGGVVRRLVDGDGKSPAKRAAERGVLCASGFVAGEGLAGVLIAGWAFATKAGRHAAAAPTALETIGGLLVLILSGAVLFVSTSRKKA